MLDNDTIKSAAAAVAFVLAGLWAYLRSPKQPPPQQNSVLTGIGMELGNREQSERQITVLTRIAVAVETLADRHTEELADIHRELLDRMDMQERREEQEEQKPRRPPPRRRP